MELVMRKLLTLFLVLCLASMANAALTSMQLSINGDTQLDEISIEPSQTVVIDLHVLAGQQGVGYVIVDENGTIGTGEWYDEGVTVVPEYVTDPLHGGYPQISAGAGDFPGSTDRYTENDWGFGYEFVVAGGVPTPSLPGGKAFEYLFHSTGQGDVVISVYADEDYENPQDQITIHQVSQSQQDLAGSIDLGTWSTALGGAKGLIRVNIENQGEVQVTGSIDLDIYISASGTLDGSETLVASYTNQNIFLNANQSTTLFKFITLPMELSTDDYYLVADLDSNNDVTESNESNNEAPSTSTIQVTEAFVDLSVSINQRSWTEALGGDRGLLFINVVNQGNTIARGTTNITIYNSTDENLDGADTLLAELTNQNIYLLPGMTRLFFSFVTLPVGLPTADYYLLAQIEPTLTLNDTNNSNNIAASNPINIQEAVVDLSGEFKLITFQNQIIAGNLGIFLISVQNGGNVAATGQIDLELWISSDGTLDGAGDYLLPSLNSLSQQRVFARPGFSQYYFAIVNFPDTVPAGTYQFIVNIDSSNDITETNETNNLILSKDTYTVN